MPRDWDDPAPREGVGADLARSALLIRTAADLWATHYTADGLPRSAEASRMRHPATLGAATRQWRALVSLAGLAADSLARSLPPERTPEGIAASLRDFPRPGAEPAPRPHSDVLDLTVARPRPGRGPTPLLDVESRCLQLRHLAWQLASSGNANSVVLGNMAAIATTVHHRAAAAHRSQAGTEPGTRTASLHLDTAAGLEEQAHLWEDVSEHVRALRSPHSATHPIQIARLDIVRMLARVSTTPPGLTADTCWGLSRIASIFSQIAAFHAESIRSAHERGDLLLMGRAVPTEALPRRPDLLEARLSNRVIPAPSHTITQLEAAYRTISGRKKDAVPDVSPPAA